MQTDNIRKDRRRRVNHAALTRLAVIANALVWVVVIISVLAAGGRWISTQNLYYANAAFNGESLRFSDRMQTDVLFALSVYADVADVFIQGVVAALVLKGISLGLFMIVETDLNFRDAKQEGD